MNIPKIVLLATFIISSLLSVSMIGKPKEPTTPNIAAIGLILCLIMCWLVVIA